MLYIFALAGAVALFLLLKLTDITFLISDTNGYIYYAQLILEGKLLYKDLFLTNLPFTPYLHTFYLLILQWNPVLILATPILEAAVVSIIIYLILAQKKEDTVFAVLASCSYLFSLTVLSSSNHQTGVYFASFTAVLAYFFYARKQYVWAGIFLGVAFMTKGYFIPVVAAFFVYDIWKRRFQFVQLAAGFTIPVICILLPTLIFAFPEFISQVFGYSVTRAQGIPKWPVIEFFIQRDWLLVLCIVLTFVYTRKLPFLAFILGFSFLFLIWYKDVYLLYFNIFIPFACIAGGEVAKILSLKFGKTTVVLGMCVLVGFSSLIAISSYLGIFSQLQKIRHTNEIVQTIQKLDPDFIYGDPELAPLFQFLTGIPPLNGIVDTNANLFRAGKYNAKELSQKAATSKTVLLSIGVEYPRLTKTIITDMYDEEIIAKNCTLVASYPVISEGGVNRINVSRCF